MTLDDVAKLPPNQARFVEEYLVDLNGRQAAIRAGYAEKSAEVQASQLLRKPKVRAAVDAALAARSERVQVTTDEVLREFKRLALVDIGQAFTPEGALKPLAEMDVDVRRSIASIEVDETWVDGKDEDGKPKRYLVGQLRKVKFWDKKGALDSLAKHKGMFIERVEHSASASLEELILAVRTVKK